MKLGDKLHRLRLLEGVARGLGRELTQSEVADGAQISQSYLSQIENGSRPHLTSGTRLQLARFFKVHPGYLVDDPDEPHLPIKPRREIDEKVDLWLIEASQEMAADRELSQALLRIAKHEQSREALILLGSLVENKVLIDRLLERLAPDPQPRRRRRNTIVER
jgi:transcriptional regulator with XRE-family HTH domain